MKTSGTKSYYGMTEDKMKRLASLAGSGEASLATHAASLREFSSMFVQHARDLAKSGQKDEARNWWRFFQNSRVLDVLQSFPSVGPLDSLRSDLASLKLECHPLDEASWQTDVEAIRFALGEILSRLPASASVSVSGSGGSVHLHDGLGQSRQENFERSGVVGNSGFAPLPGFSGFSWQGSLSAPQKLTNNKTKY